MTKTSKTVMDVSRPGKSAPSPTSKSVIVTNRPRLKDPMFVTTIDVKSKPSPSPSPTLATIKLDSQSDSSQSLKIEGLDKLAEASTEAKVKDKPVVVEEPEKELVTKDETAPDIVPQSDKPTLDEPTDEPITEKVAVDPDKIADDVAKTSQPPVMPTTLPEKPSPPTEPSPVTSPVPVEQPNSPGNTDKPVGVENDEAGEDPALSARQAELDKMLESEQYFLPITSPEQKRSRHRIIIGSLLFVFLTLLWIDIALDAGIIKIGGVDGLTHFFSN
ncbi:MAG: hypothetical protein NVS1B10_03440 [Candidatus Saccharimonadales bacterium]